MMQRRWRAESRNVGRSKMPSARALAWPSCSSAGAQAGTKPHGRASVRRTPCSRRTETSDVPGAPDQIDLNISVVEKPTGSLQLGAGFSSAERLALSFAIRQENAFGTGNYLGVELNTSKYNRTVVFNSVNPYFTPDGISRTIDL